MARPYFMTFAVAHPLQQGDRGHAGAAGTGAATRSEQGAVTRAAVFTVPKHVEHRFGNTGWAPWSLRRHRWRRGTTPPPSGRRHDFPRGPRAPACGRWPTTLQEVAVVNTGDTAWILTSAALVLLMTPGLALFYGGMVRAKSVLNMMMMSFGALALISVIWVIYGYSMAFGNDVGGGLLGSPTAAFGLKGLMEDVPTEPGGVPAMAFVGFQAVFAIITVALISGAIADRAKFGAWMVFAGVWATIVYFPVAHWVFDFDADGHVGGWIANSLKVIDFAGGTAVHINAGAAGLALALVLGKRRGFGREAMRPHNLTLVMIGAGLLWFGWFGFNAGSALAANNTAAVVWVNTMVATGAATLGWLLVEKLRDGHSTSLGAASGVVAGLVAITPSCSSVSPIGAIIVGAVAGVLCALAVG